MAFDKSKVLEKDNSKVDSDVLENSFNFDGAFVDDADFSKAKLIIPSTKQVITVEQGIQFINRNHGEERKKALETAEKETLLVERFMMRDRVEKAFAKNMIQKKELQQAMEGFFGTIVYEKDLPKFMQDEKKNEKFIDLLEIKKKDKEAEHESKFRRLF